ncbi:unnamed protein product [Colias eurytheme]|nr:unnamed protein product [Colias eurytheme]
MRFSAVLFALFGVAISENTECRDEVCEKLEGNATRVLSRSKRFLVFPDGSSLQLVFCLQTAALIPIQDIFLYSNTAALAWTLPTDPKTLLMFKEYEKNGIRRTDTEKNVYYLDSDGRIMAKVPFRRPAIVNPAFAKRSVNEASFKDRLKVKIDRMKMHERQKGQMRQTGQAEQTGQMEHFPKLSDSISFHRNSRVDLYQKLEALITTLGADGRQCVLRKLCESARLADQGTFLQEVIRVVFTFPKHSDVPTEDHKIYEEAHDPTHDCEKMYPGCENFDKTM